MTERTVTVMTLAFSGGLKAPTPVDMAIGSVALAISAQRALPLTFRAATVAVAVVVAFEVAVAVKSR